MSAHARKFPRLAASAALAALALAVPPAQAQDALWPDAPWRAFVTGDYPQGFLPSSLAAGDMDGDGDVDVVVGQSFFGGPGVSVLENRGDGSYLPPVYYALAWGRSLGEVALADFDGDGDRDAFATIRGANDDEAKLLVWRNDGGGALAAPIEFATGQAPVGIVVADFTGDGKPDVATANYYWSAQTVSFLKHNGQAGAGAGFLPRTDIGLGMRAERLAAADVNGDGRPDLAVGGFADATNISYLSILVNDGAGGFAAPVVYQAAPGAYQTPVTAVSLRDLDNDGDADLIGGGVYENGSVMSGAITIRRNAGQGAFGAHEAHVLGDYVPPPRSLATADLDGDGFPEVVSSAPSARAIDGFVVLPSSGTGSFGTPVYYEAEQSTCAAAAFDADGDGDFDVTTVAQYSAALTVHANPGNGDFRVLSRFPLASLIEGVESADIDNDGDIDVVTNSEADIASHDAVIHVLKNNGDGTFALAATYVYPPPRNFADFRLRDLNGDGFVDMVLSPDYPPYDFGTAFNNGDGTFAPVVVHALGSCGEGSIDAFDLDGDGDRDVVVTEEELCVSVPLPRIWVLRNDNGGQNFVLVAALVTGQFAFGIEGADLTGDGRLDLVSAMTTGMGVIPNNGGFSFGAPLISSSIAYKFKLADFNGDGKLDAGMILPQDRVYEVDVATALGLGGGLFAPARVQRGSNTAESLRISDDLDVGDFDRDGHLDLLAFNYASNDLSAFLNAGDGALLPQQRYGVGNTPRLGTVADFDGDGRPDVAAAIGLPPSGLQNALVVLRAVPTENFTLSCTPAALTILPGSNGTSTCTVRSLSAFSSAVALSCTGLPAGATCAFSPGTVTPPANGTASSTLTVSVDGATPPGPYTFQARGASGSLVHTFNMSLTVPAAADFSLSCGPSSLTVAQGGIGTSTCTVQSLNAFASPVALSCTGLPAGVTCAYSPGAVTPPANGAASSTLTVSVASGATPGVHAFQAQGVSGALVRTFDMSLTVLLQAVAPFTLSVDAGGNGVLEPNETVVLAPAWWNAGGAPVTLSGATSGFTGPAGAVYTNPDARATYGTIGVASSGTCVATGDCYSVAIGASTRPATHWDATIVETMTPTGATKAWTLHVGDSFADVPASGPFYRFVETILHENVTGGCTATTFCPFRSTTREQMAVFVLAARELPGYVPPPCGATPLFPDVPVSSPYCRWIEELARRGVAGGCGGGNYCPSSPVSREQMAVFVLRTLDPALDPPACGTPIFADVPAFSPFCRWIEELVRRGVVTGCGGGNYCPTADVSREQMSVFLTVTFGLALYGP